MKEGSLPRTPDCGLGHARPPRKKTRPWGPDRAARLPAILLLVSCQTASSPLLARSPFTSHGTQPGSVAPLGTLVTRVPGLTRERLLRRRFFPESKYRIRKLRDGRIRFIHPGFTVDVRPDGTVHFHDKSLSGLKLALGFAFDLTDTIMRAKGQDPYAAAKLQFLRETRPWRLRLRRRWRRRTSRRALAAVDTRLQTIWKDPKLNLETKKRIFFQLWDELQESGTGPLAERARIARLRILSFIETHLPPTGPGSYSPGELARLNRKRTSKHFFDPYGRHRLRTGPRAGRPSRRARVGTGRKSASHLPRASTVTPAPKKDRLQQTAPHLDMRRPSKAPRTKPHTSQRKTRN